MKSDDKTAENAKVSLHTTYGVKKPAGRKNTQSSSNEDQIMNDSQIEKGLPAIDQEEFKF